VTARGTALSVDGIAFVYGKRGIFRGFALLSAVTALWGPFGIPHIPEDTRAFIGCTARGTVF
jgi:hypothetical protein